MMSILRSFPRATEVFSDPSWMERVLAAFAVVELYDGTRLPVAVPFEPAAGRLGERTRGVHTAFASPDRIGFRLLPNGTLDFLGDPAFFELIHRANHGEQSRGLTAFYEDQYAGFHAARGRGVLPEGTVEEVDPDLEWLETDVFGDDDEFDDEHLAAPNSGSASETMPNGTPFTKILTVDPGDLLPRSTGTFTLWWEPESSTVLITRRG